MRPNTNAREPKKFAASALLPILVLEVCFGQRVLLSLASGA